MAAARKFSCAEDVLKNPVKDNREGLVNAKDVCPELIVNLEPESRRMQRIPENTCYVREGVALRLKRAQELLPRGYRLMLWEGFRCRAVQEKIFDDYRTKLKRLHPEWSQERLAAATETFVADPDKHAPHSTGGAVDVTIIGPEGNALDMGTAIDEFSRKSTTSCSAISAEAVANRKLLRMVMTKAGFVNYPFEWWHWSYGEREWALALGKKRAVYGPVKKE